MKKSTIYSLVYLWLAASLAFVSPAVAIPKSIPEDVAIYNFINNFTIFSKWPDSERRNTVNVCILGVPSEYANNIKAYLDAATAKNIKEYKENASTAKGPRIYNSLLFPKTDKISSSCNILYIGQDAKEDIDGILSSTKDQAVLTISNIPGFVSKGGIAELSRIDKNMKIGVVNVAAADKIGIHIGADILEYAAKVIGK